MNSNINTKNKFISFLLFLFLTIFAGQNNKIKGKYFYKVKYIKKPIPEYENCKDKFSVPILDEHPIWIEMYWKCWKIAFQGINEPGEESPLHGIKDLQVGEMSVSLICDKRDSVNATPHLKVQNNKAFTLSI